MPLHVAFLRGMNIGRRRITNEALTACFEQLGYKNVRPYQASGNVVFDAGRKPLAKLKLELEAGLQAQLDYAVPTFVRTADQVRTIATHEPFTEAQQRVSSGKLQVVLLQTEPTAAQRDAVLQLHNDQDQLAFGEAALYWLPIGRLSDSLLDFTSIEKTLGTTTTRTHGTMTRLTTKFLSD